MSVLRMAKSSEDSRMGPRGQVTKGAELLDFDCEKRVARRRKALGRINELPSFSLPQGFDSVASLVAASREDHY